MTKRIHIASESTPRPDQNAKSRWKRTNAAGSLRSGTARSSLYDLGSALKTGQYVKVQVLKSLPGGKWAVALGGRVFPASADAPLAAGKSFFAWVEQTDDRVLLHLSDPAAQSLMERLFGRPSGKLPVSDAMVTALFRSHISVSPEIIVRLSELFFRFKRLLHLTSKADDHRLARLLAILFDKGIDPRSPGMVYLLALLGGFAGGEKNGGRRREPNLDDKRAASQIKQDIADRGEEDGNPLQLFNHLKGKSGSWIAVPFRYRLEGKSYHGTLRVLLDNYSVKPLRGILDIVTEKQEKLSFQLTHKGRHIRMAAYAKPKAAKADLDREYRQLAELMQNHGIDCDDTVYDGEDFDGFSETTDTAYYGIDTYT
jgi:hypothetical protein